MELINLFTLLEEAVLHYQNESLLRVIEDGKIKNTSYYDIYINVKKWGDMLFRENISEQNIALIGDFNEKWITSFFSLIYANNTVVPVDGELPFKEIIACMQKAECYSVFISSKFYGKYNEEYKKCEHINFIVYDGDIKRTWKNNCIKSQNWNKEYAMIVYTSGTSGSMKPAVLTHKNIIKDVEYCYDIMKSNITNSDKVLSVLPPFHMFHIVAGFLAPIKLGCAICCDDIKYMESEYSGTHVPIVRTKETANPLLRKPSFR